MTTNEKEIAYGNIILAQAGLPPMTPEQQALFLAKRGQRLAVSAAYQSSLWFRGCIVSLVAGAGLGFFIGRKTK